MSIIRLGIKNGINFFDTGNNYGDTENILGNLTNKEKSKIIISTKGKIMKKAKKVKTTEFTGGLRMYKKPQPIVLKGWAVTNDLSY